MTKIDNLIKRYNDFSTGCDDADIFIKVKLKMIRSLFEEIKGSEDRIYMEEIISKFAEIMDCQHEIIMDEIIAADGYGPPQHNWVTVSGKPVRVATAHSAASYKLTADDIPWDPECEFEEDDSVDDPPSYLPPEGGFQTDEQVKKAFTNYLKYHAKRKSGKGLSDHTIYDYTSRCKVLMEIVCGEWLASNKDCWIPLNEQNLQAGCPFLNAYNNLSVLKLYVERKERELQDISMGLRKPAPESQKNPLNNIRNLHNTSAALTRFEEFKKSVLEQ